MLDKPFSVWRFPQNGEFGSLVCQTVFLFTFIDSSPSGFNAAQRLQRILALSALLTCVICFHPLWRQERTLSVFSLCLTNVNNWYLHKKGSWFIFWFSIYGQDKPNQRSFGEYKHLSHFSVDKLENAKVQNILKGRMQPSYTKFIDLYYQTWPSHFLPSAPFLCKKSVEQGPCALFFL